MNTRVSLLTVALLVGVCCAARCQELPVLPEPVLAVQRCFPQATVRLLPEVRYNGEIAPLRVLPPVISTISPDGKRLFFIREMDPRGWQSYFLDLTTGEVSIAKMPDQQLVALGGMMPLPYIEEGIWDPIAPSYLYASFPETNTYENGSTYSIWRINVETLVGQQILPPGTNRLYNITPDGRYLLFYRPDEGIHQPYLYSLETHTWKPQPENMMLAMRTYAPNGELVAGFTNTQGQPTVLAIRDVMTDRLAQVFNQNQVLFSVPPGARPDLIGTPTWLPDSAGLLVNIVSLGDNSFNTIWHVGINGEARPIASGVAVVANSQNGRHWLLQHGQQFYVIAVGDESPEE